MARRGARTWLAAAIAAFAVLALAPGAGAVIPASLLSSCSPRDAADGNTANGIDLPYSFCDDGVPAVGGTTPNVGGLSAVTVPGSYAGIAGLPAKQGTVPGADPSGDIALDVDVSLPDPARFPAAGGKFPVVVLMHGCCSGSKTSWEGSSIDPGGAENWHYNNAWFASRGYIVVTYTARGFVNSNGRGSTGETQLDSARYEINDYQSIVGQLADMGDLAPGVKVDPQRIVPTGGSYGGGFAWLALTDPTWKSPGAATDMRVAAAAPKYGWTNLVESLVPRGDDRRDALPETDPARAKALLQTQLGFPKRTIVAALYASGKTGVPPGSSRTTFPAEIDQAIACLSSFDPFESNPLCTATGVTSTVLGRFIDERSAYFQQRFFEGLANGSIDPVPVFSAGTFTDQLFPSAEHRRMVERLKATRPGYPVQEYYGDYNHFVQNKRKEWADLCGADRHVCTYADYPGGTPASDLNADPASLAARGATTRLNRFIDFYAKPPGDAGATQPAFDVTGSLQVCPQNAAFLGAKPDEPGPRFTAGSFGALAPNLLTVSARGTQTTTSKALPNVHAVNADPVGNLARNGGRCPVESSPGDLASAGPGVATYDSAPLPRDYTMLGSTRLEVAHTGTGSGLQLNARLYELAPDGTQVLADRGVRRLGSRNGPTTFDLHGAGWRFRAGSRLRLELAQDDDPYIKSSVQPSSLTISSVKMTVPVRETSATVGGAAAPKAAAALRAPRLASDQGIGTRFRMRVRRSRSTPAGVVDRYEVEGRDTRARRGRLIARNLRGSLVRFRGKRGRTYRFRVRAIARSGEVGAWSAAATTVVPYEDGRRATRALRYGGAWMRPRSRRAWGRRLSRSSARGATLSLRLRGSRIYLIGRRGPRGGLARVRLNGRTRTVRFYGRRTRNRVVVASLRGKRRGVNRLTVSVLGRRGARRSRGRRVEIDAIGARRP